MNPRVRIIFCLMLAAAAGCSSISPTQVGQAVGAIAGSAIAPGIGTQLGSIAGILAGMVAQGHIDKATEKKERKVLGEQLAKKPQPAPQAAAAGASGTPTRVWVDETLLDGRVLAGRFETRYLL